MRHPIRNILLIILLALVIGGIYGAYLYNKAPKKVEDSEVVAELSADQLYTEFSADEQAALSKYEEKVVQVSGEIYALELDNDLEPQIVLGTEDPSGFVRCGFKPDMKDQIEALKEGQQLKLKGFCNGMNKGDGLDLLSDVDIILSKCIIIE